MIPIQVRDRDIECPQGFTLSVQGDNGIETICFDISRTYRGVDLSKGFAYVIFSPLGGTEGTAVLLDKDVRGESISLIWKVGKEATAQAGSLRFQLRISGLDALLWNSHIAIANVAGSISAETPQPIVYRANLRMSGGPVEFPENEPPITVSERKINIPKELQNIAVQNDQNSEKVKILLPRYFDGHDLSSKRIYLKTVSAGGRDDILLSNKSAASDMVELHWILKPPQTSYQGKLQLQIYVESEEFKWETDSTSVNIITSLDADPVIPLTPSIVDDFIRELAAIADGVKGSEESAKQSAQAAAQSVRDAQAIKDSTEIFYDVNGDRVGFKRANEEGYMYTDHLTGPKGDRGEDGVMLFPSFEMELSSGELMLDLPDALSEVTFGINEDGVLQYELIREEKE